MEPEAQENEKRGRISLILGITFTFLFALTWGLPSVFNWVFLGASSYSFFLYWYYSPRTISFKGFEANRAYEYQDESPAQRYERVFKKVKRIIGLSSAGIFILFFIVQIFSREEQTTLPNVEIDGSESIEQDQASVWNDIGDNFYQNKQYDSALFYYEKVLRLESGNGRSWYSKGMVYYGMEQMDKALDSFSRAYDTGIRDAFLSHVLAYMNDNSGNTSKAIGLYKEAVGLDSSRSDIYARLAELEPFEAARYKALEEKWKN